MASSISGKGPGAPTQNQNAKGHSSPRKGKTGASRTTSMPHETWEAFKSACDLYAGHVLDDDDIYKDEWKRIESAAITAFIKRHQGLEDPSVAIIV